MCGQIQTNYIRQQYYLSELKVKKLNYSPTVEYKSDGRYPKINYPQSKRRQERKKEKDIQERQDKQKPQSKSGGAKPGQLLPRAFAQSTCSDSSTCKLAEVTE